MFIPQSDPREAYEKLVAGGGVWMIDVRTPGEYASERVEVSESIPLDKLDAEAIKSKVNGEVVYVLCRTGNRSTEAAEKLASAGVNAQVIDGGLDAWRKAGLPVEKGKGPISLERQVRIGAGALVLIGVGLGVVVHPGFHLLAAFVGAGLVFAGVTDWCGMAKLLGRLPWNR